MWGTLITSLSGGWGLVVVACVRLSVAVAVLIGVEGVRAPRRAEVEGGCVVFAGRGCGGGVDRHPADRVDGLGCGGLLLAEHGCFLSMGVMDGFGGCADLDHGHHGGSVDGRDGLRGEASQPVGVGDCLLYTSDAADE